MKNPRQGSLALCGAFVLSLSLLLELTKSQTIVTVNDLPSFQSNDDVDFYYCESSFPFNAPKSIIAAAGPSFSEYSTAVAGLGIWDITTDVKLTIQVVSNNYVGALLPVLTPNPDGPSGFIYWNNSASIVVTNPLNTDAWTNSRHISSASGTFAAGVAYLDLVNYLQANQDSFSVYQPVTIVQPTKKIVAANSSAFSGNTNNGLGDIILDPQNSYAFVNTLMQQLASFGVDLDTFLNVKNFVGQLIYLLLIAVSQAYDNSFAYLMANDTELSTVEWDVGGLANEDVFNWFKDLEQCYDTAYEVTVNENGGAQYFLEYLSEHCYNHNSSPDSADSNGSNGNGAYAYVYKTQNSVYNISLMNFSSYASPVLFRSYYTLPSTPANAHPSLNAIDYIMIAAFIIFALGGTYIFITKFLSKSQRRRVSFEGERIAEKTVAAQTEAEQDTESNYYTSRDSLTQRHLLQARQSTLHSLLTFGSSKTGSQSRTDLNTRLDPDAGGVN